MIDQDLKPIRPTLDLESEFLAMAEEFLAVRHEQFRRGIDL